MSNVPPEPDEFQTRMRTPDPSGDTDATHRPGERPDQPTSPFAPPGYGGAASAPGATAGAPTGSTPPGYAQQPPQPFGQVSQPGYGQASQQGYGQPSQPQSFGQPGYGQPASAPPTQQQPFGAAPPAGYPQPGAFGQPGQAGQPGPSSSGPPSARESSGLKAAFDLGFGSYATPGIVKLVYVIGVVLTVLVWLFYVVIGFLAGPLLANPFTGEGPGPIAGVVALVVGWIPGLLFILLLRVGLEQALATVRTATDVRVLRDRSDAEADGS